MKNINRFAVLTFNADNSQTLVGIEQAIQAINLVAPCGITCDEFKAVSTYSGQTEYIVTFRDSDKPEAVKRIPFNDEDVASGCWLEIVKDYFDKNINT